MKFILGKKQAMTQLFAADGTVIPVTKVTAGPCLVMAKKTIENDGYVAVQCGFETKKKNNKALTGLFKKMKMTPQRTVREFRMESTDPMVEKLNTGDQLTVSMFQAGDSVNVSGISKGKGFQGVVKRHGFKGGKKSHGHKDQLRMPGSIGATGPAHVFKGTRMGGRMGGDSVTVTGLEIVDVDVAENVLYIKGALPGARNGVLKIVGVGEFEATQPVVEEKKKDTPATEAKADVKEEKKEEAPVTEEKSEEKKEAPATKAKDEVKEEKKEDSKPAETK